MLQHDEQHMRRALELAEQARGRTSPNPMVGCVIVHDGTVVAEGFHHYAGGDHAEIEALNALELDPAGCELFVTLEPCTHQGRTPPCSDALINAGLKRVVIGATDPNPRVSGSGIEALRQAGIPVVSGILQAACERLNEAFGVYITRGRPFVTLKQAITLDGKIATSGGDSKWISNERSRALVHEMRDQSDAILVGRGTLSSDNPSLTARPGNDPIRIVLDSQLRSNPNHTLFHLESSSPTWIATAKSAEHPDAKRYPAASLLTLPLLDGAIDLQALMLELGRREIMTLLVEAGSQIASAFLEAGIVDRLALFIAPLLAGSDAMPMLGPLGLQKMALAPRLIEIETRRLDDNVFLTGLVKPS